MAFLAQPDHASMAELVGQGHEVCEVVILRVNRADLDGVFRELLDAGIRIVPGQCRAGAHDYS